MRKLDSVRQGSSLQLFKDRIFIASILVVLFFLLLLLRLVYLQIVRHDDLRAQAENNRTAVTPLTPTRGLIFDRNGILLATNYSAYSLEIDLSRVKDLEGTIKSLQDLIDISPRDLRAFNRIRAESRRFDKISLKKRLSKQEVSRFAAQRFRFPGVDIQSKLYRSYPYGELGSHVIGYIGRINPKEKEAIVESEDQANYRGTEYIGKLGLEGYYEKELHGITGVSIVETSAGGRAVRQLKGTLPSPGANLKTSIDIQLQHLAETLFGNRRGALVAIEPKTGEVLAFVSKPTFDPNLFVDGIDHESWNALSLSPNKPLLNRALRGTYPPGSTYKPFMALAALETGARTPKQSFSDPGFFMLGAHRFRDDKEDGHGLVDMYKSIVDSCDTYYYQLANDMGIDVIHAQMKRYGFGDLTGVDLPGEVKGLLPSRQWKRDTFKTPAKQSWYSGETISLGIGQGYNNFTMLQLASAVSAIANNGQRMRPHFVKEISTGHTSFPLQVIPEKLGGLIASPVHLAVIKNALVGVPKEGTSKESFVGTTYQSAGKTGTAQVINIKQDEQYDAKAISERFRDHALYTAYAPANEPQIALAIIIENAGFGGANAAPIARRLFDYWLLKQYPSEQDIAAVIKGLATFPIGTPQQVPLLLPTISRSN